MSTGETKCKVEKPREGRQPKQIREIRIKTKEEHLVYDRRIPVFPVTHNGVNTKG
jgi:hypothetical protein